MKHGLRRSVIPLPERFESARGRYVIMGDAEEKE